MWLCGPTLPSGLQQQTCRFDPAAYKWGGVGSARIVRNFWTTLAERQNHRYQA